MTTGSMLLEASSSQGMRSLWLNSSRSIAWARPIPSTLGSVDLCFREWHTLMTFFLSSFCFVNDSWKKQNSKKHSKHQIKTNET